jgi:O-antigen/teichoic acid export membrane protein
MTPTTAGCAKGSNSWSEGLGHKIRGAYLWTSVLQVGKNLLGFAISILLARWLQPSDYGLVGMVTVLISIVSVFQDWGIGQAVIYFRDESEEHLATYFTVTTATGLLLTLITFLSAPVIAGFYHEPRLVAIVQALSLTFLLGGLWAVSQGLLTKHFRFQRLTLTESACTLGSGLIAVVMAWKGYGVWSLVANILIQNLAQTVLYCWIVRPRFTLRIDRALLKKVISWGMPLAGSSLLFRFYDNSDYLVIGKLLGAPALGAYTLAFRLATMVNDKISSVVNRVSFPSFSAMQDDVDSVVRHWLSVTRKLAWLNFPVLVAIAMNAEDFISIFLGPKWQQAGPLVKYLCVVGALKTLNPLVFNLLSARGRTEIGFQNTLLNSVLLPISFLLACRIGSVTTVCIAWCVVFPCTSAFLIYRAAKLVGISFWSFLRDLRAPALTAAVCLAVMLPISWLAPFGLFRLCLRSAVGLAGFAACLWFQKGVRQSLFQLIQLRPGSAVSAS